MIKQTKYGWVDLSKLVRTNNGKISWKESVGLSVEFQYMDICGSIFILDWINSKIVKIKIPNYIDECTIRIENIVDGKLGVVAGKYVRHFRYNAGEIVNQTLLITSTYRCGELKYYNYKCLKDGYEGYISEPNLQKGRRCPVCAGQVVMCGVNDIATTRPEVASLFWDAKDATKYTAFSTHKVDFKCPRCGNKINVKIYNVTCQGLSCRKCGDSFSYPEKFMYNLLQQVCNLHHSDGILRNFELQKTFSWSKNIQHSNSRLSGDKIYDFYVPLPHSIIIEVHGKQHFKQCSFGSNKPSRTLDEEQENDDIKQVLAIKNGILRDRYITLDCRESNIEFIKHSIMSSTLPSLLEFVESDIDWDMCNVFATSSRVYEACLLWNSGMHIIKDIAHKMKLHRDTIHSYLRRGEEFGIVQDPPKHIKKKTQQND